MLRRSRIGIPDTLLRRKATNIGESTLRYSVDLNVEEAEMKRPNQSIISPR